MMNSKIRAVGLLSSHLLPAKRDDGHRSGDDLALAAELAVWNCRYYPGRAVWHTSRMDDGPEPHHAQHVHVSVWSGMGYCIVILLSGLQGISQTYYEAARIDGASGLQQFFKITVPLLTPTIFFLLVTRIIAAFNQYDMVYMMADSATSGAVGPISDMFEDAGIWRVQLPSRICRWATPLPSRVPVLCDPHRDRHSDDW